MEVKDQYYDSLTGAFSRKFHSVFIDREIKRVRRYGGTFSIILIDIDNFKEINERFGKLHADRILVEFTKILSSLIREVDLVVRYRGDLFIVILPNTDGMGAEVVAQRIIKSMESKEIGGIRLGVSIGIATYPDDGVDWESLFEYADRGLYVAKRSGKGRIGRVGIGERGIIVPTREIVGRREEVRWIKERIGRSGVLHLVGGEAGIGKTRLITDVARDSGGIFISGTSYGAVASIPYFIIRELLRDLYKKYRMELEESYEGLSIGLKSEIGKLLPVLSKGTSGVQEADRYRLYDAVVELLSQIGSKRQVVILLDDLHWADEASSELLYYMMKMLYGEISIFGAYRTDEIKGTSMERVLELMGRERLYDELILGPLSYGEVRVMSEIILQSEVSDELADLIYKESGGNPFFVEEVVKALYEGGGIRYEEGIWEIEEGKEIEIPKGIEDTVKRKIGKLSEEERVILEYASCMGREIDPGLLEAISGMNEGEVYDVLDKFVKYNILEESGVEGYVFREGVIKEVVIRGITKGRLRVMHNKIAGEMERYYAREIREHVEEIAYHYHEGFDRRKIVEYGELAGDKAREVYAHREAIKYYLWAVDGEATSEKRGEIYEKIGDSYMYTGDYEAAIESYERAIEYRPERRSELEEKIGDIYMYMGEYGSALKWYEKAKEHAPSMEKKYVYDIDIAWILKQQGKQKEAERKLLTVLKYLSTSQKASLATAHNVLGTIYMDTAREKEAEEHLKKALKLREEVGDKKGMAAVYNNLGILYTNQDQYEKGMEYYLKAKKIYEEINFKDGIATMALNMGVLYVSLNDFDKAMEYYKQAMKINQVIGAKHQLILVYRNLGSLYTTLGLKDQALMYYEKAFEIAKEIDSPYDNVTLLLRFADISIEKNDFDKAAEYLEEARRILDDLEDESLMTSYYDTLSDFYEEQGKYSEAYETLKKAYELTKQFNPNKDSSAYLYYYLALARLAAKCGKQRSAKIYLNKALSHPYAKSDLESRKASLSYNLGLVYKALRDKEKARKYLEDALKYYSEKGHKDTEERIKKELAEL